ncbi:MAG: universal stress protein [Acidobacteriota bacterium]
MVRRMKVIIGYDGTSYSDVALNELRQAGLPRRADVMLLCAIEPMPACTAESMMAIAHNSQTIQAKVEKAVEEARDKLRTNFPEWMIQQQIMHGSPMIEIPRMADEWDADLIVTGTHDPSWLERLLVGSVSRSIASNAACSVRVVREHRGHHGPSARLLIGLDDSENIQAVIDKVASRQWKPGTEARLVLTAGLEPIPDSAPKPQPIGSLPGIQAAERELSAVGLNATSVINESGKAQFVLDEADRWDADCVFVSHHNTGLFERILFGSLPALVTGRAHCSVEIIRDHPIPRRKAVSYPKLQREVTTG